jgi:uncharacterized lipoprotein YmbA
MTLRIAAITLAAALPLLSCGDTNARFPIASAPEAAVSKARVAVATIEVREVSLPTYASASEIMVENADGSLTVVSKAIWADDPTRGVTGALTKSLDLRSTASVAAEPWPLDEPAAVRLEVRVDRMIAKIDGNFELSGQFAIASPDGIVRESLQRFSVTAAMTDGTPASVAKATGVAIDNLADEIIKKLRR